MTGIRGFFKLDKNGTDVKTEIIAGLTTFLTMSYIIVVNPSILSTNGTGISFAGALTATVLVSAISSILMGLVANLPFALAPGMGINAFFTFSVILGMGVPWQKALGTVFISGIIFILLTLVKFREKIVFAIPECVRYGVATGIGLFLALIGLKQAGLIVASPATLIKFGGFTPQVILFLIGMLFTLFLFSRKIIGSLLISILFTTLIAFLNGRLWGSDILIKGPQSIMSDPDFSAVFFKLDISGAFSFELLAVIFTFLFTDMFDSISTFLGVSQVANLKDDKGRPKNLKRALFVDAISTTISGLFGTSSGTTYIESAAGVDQGGRTGLTAVVVGLLFLPFLYFSPVLQIIPSFATSPALVLVGFFMMSSIGKVKFSEFDEGMPAFLACILIPFTYSITQGISWALIAYTLLKIFKGKANELSGTIYVIDVLAIATLILI
ncbi:MAG: NCS2 family permease [Bacteriovoracaceae bacterium]|nr:NCS2 family permease [Bacteriovoracaceae bacterium]